MKQYTQYTVADNVPRCHIRSKVWVRILLTLLLTTTFTTLFYWDSIFVSSVGDISCFHDVGNVLDELNDAEPTKGASIFFHETSCQKYCNDIRLNARQACSVESALIAHPEKDVFLLVSGPVLVPVAGSQNTLIHTLLKYSNFKLRHISFSKYLSGTPMTVIEESGALNSSRWPVAHASDILRYATLYKFGGIYLDLDVIVLKSLSGLVNFVGAESNSDIGSGILGFGSDKVGREVATDCANELARTFNGNIWGFNGPGVITRVLERRCKTKLIRNMTKANCGGFDVHPTQSFTPIPYQEVQKFFTEDKEKIIPKLLNQSYTVHFWNKMSSDISLGIRSNVPFINYAKIYCPSVFKIVNVLF